MSRDLLICSGGISSSSRGRFGSSVTEFSTKLIDCSLLVFMGNALPPRDTDEDEDDEDEEEADEAPIVREPDED